MWKYIRGLLCSPCVDHFYVCIQSRNKALVCETMELFKVYLPSSKPFVVKHKLGLVNSSETVALVHLYIYRKAPTRYFIVIICIDHLHPGT